MRTKLILWGETKDEKKVLVTVELLENENKVTTNLIDEKDASEEFYNLLLNEWRFGKEVEFPENMESISKPLSSSEDILPDGLKVEKADLVNRAKTEWLFIVLSRKLYDFYKDELTDLKDKVVSLNKFSLEYWDKLKEFWSKVQRDIRDKSLYRDHADSLKKKTDDLFDTLKKFRKEEESKLRQNSEKFFTEFNEKLDKIEEKIEKGLGLQPIFDELKGIQNSFFKTSFSRDHRRKVWNRIDKAFKKVKVKKFGNSPSENNPVSRLQRRYDGLLGAIEKMQKSIERDKKDMKWQNDFANESGNQLQVQLREAKVAMIKERINSKAERLEDMNKTKASLEKRIEAEKKKEKEKELLEQAKKEAKEKIKGQVEESNKLLEENKEELEKAAEKMHDSKSNKNENIGKENKDKAEEKQEEKSTSIIDKVSEKIEDVVEKVEDIAEIVAENVKETVEEIKDKLEEE